ncbi:MAG: hypothetical protein KAF40_01935 [Flavihumibacter sp.]|nr:hypothetical protein [Flavihumibacter sp.]
MNNDELVAYIRDANIYNVRQIEIAAGLSAGTLAKAIKGDRKLSESAIMKILFVFEKCGIKPV